MSRPLDPSEPGPSPVLRVPVPRTTLTHVQGLADQWHVSVPEAARTLIDVALEAIATVDQETDRDELRQQIREIYRRGGV